MEWMSEEKMSEIQLNPNIEENKRISTGGVILLAVLGLLFLYLIGQKTHITCARLSDSEVSCDITSVWMGSITVSSKEVSHVRNAYVESSYDSEDDSTTYRVVLRSSEGDVPVSLAYSSGNKSKNELANEINSFIKDPTRTEGEFAYKSAGGIITAIVVAVFFVSLAAGMFFRRSRN
jgi:hypothetical protein